jgi:uncharacterized Zn finger protein (UPF0148 family)
MDEAEQRRETCPVCGAMLSEGDRTCPRCGAGVTRDRTLDEPVAARPDGPLPDPEPAQGAPRDDVDPPEDVDYRERKPSYEAGFRPPAPDAD